MEKPRAVLVHPDSKGNYIQGTIARENLGLGYLASHLQQNGFEVEIIDSRITRQMPEQVAQSVLSELPVIVGLSLITIEGSRWSEEMAAAVKSEAKDKAPHVVLGNYFPSLQPRRALESVPSADSVVQGEGDLTMLELATKVASEREWRGIKGLAYRENGGVRFGQRRELITNLDQLPFPQHYAAEYGLKEFAIEGSRSCYCRCSFCGVDPHFQAESPSLRWRARSPRNIVTEIKQTRQKYPDVDTYRFVDPDFAGAPKHADRLQLFAHELQASGEEINFIIDARSKEIVTIPKAVWRELKNTGLTEVYLGVETASPHIKKMMRKGATFEDDKRAVAILNDLGINTRFGWMMVTPWTKEEDIEFNARALSSLGFARLDKYFQEMNLIPGTEALDLAKKTVDIWADLDNLDYFTYEVPPVIDNLRQIGRTLVHEHVDYLERFFLLHKQIERYSQINPTNVGAYQTKLNELNLSFFLSVFSGAKELAGKVTSEAIKEMAESVASGFELKLANMEQDCRLLDSRD